MAQDAAVSYASHMPRRHSTHPHQVAHEQTIIDEWIEDDGVYVTLRTASAAPKVRASAGAAELAQPDSQAPAASPPLPTLR